VEGAGLVTAGRRALAVTLLAVALPVLAGCEAAQQAQEVGQGVDKARDCAGLVGELTGVDWGDVQRAPAQAEQAARNLDERLREVNDADVKQAGETLRTRVQRLAEAARQADQADVRRALADVEAAARRLAQTCNVPVEQVGG
jgi:hypothetical protein